VLDTRDVADIKRGGLGGVAHLFRVMALTSTRLCAGASVRCVAGPVSVEKCRLLKVEVWR
jgi:hypothetical protein